jgi:hypothetical protein
MSEFGHFGAVGNGFCIDAWGAGPFILGEWIFEDSDRFGPLLLDKIGNPLEKQPSERSSFWRPYHIWLNQGRKVESDGKTCVWQQPKPTKVMRLGKRTAIVIENGDELGEIIVIPFDPGHPILQSKKDAKL